ncbi:hypothetical protein JAAARDRAFT_41298 [Jaapia argillacea MUCL 33604]|uniref:Protein-S-isoprenylcysteine O-methyltransferase n=1 Tax=Jaapia argillacea MUCL 33604 TaxID=933084 RepID=A0A067PBL9_9AGAM|nr:hypothetical protein JAAARDRAFT_41298 [Jaapia argillacea MUCL 33604]
MAHPPLLKIPLLLILAASHHLSFTPPKELPNNRNLPSPPIADNEPTSDKRSRPPWIMNPALFFFKTVIWAAALGEATVLISQRYPSLPFTHQIMRLLVQSQDSSPQLTVPLDFLLGFMLGVAGASIRYSCYRALGHFFTFNLKVQNKQRLITWGPYSVVRHPSYTGALLCGGGVFLCLFSRGSWVRECGILENQAARLVLSAYVLSVSIVYIMLLCRAPGEDEMMRKEFGKEWDEWARRVPYRLIPGLF